MTSSTKNPNYIEIDGFRLSEAFMPQNFRSAFLYEPFADDVFVASYPKCGNTWMCRIVLLILNRGDDFMSSSMDYWMRCPFLEYMGAEATEMRIRPGCIKTHLPFNCLRYSKEAKYIYVARHPRDCVVSFYHHTRFFPIYRFTHGTFDDFFQLFIRGETDYNDYFDNLLSWYEHRDEPNIYFTTYESLKNDHRGSIVKIADFLGKQHSDVVKGDLLDAIVQGSSFEHMKVETNKIFNDMIPTSDSTFLENPLAKYMVDCFRRATEEGHKSVGEFVRNGLVGEGKSVLSEEQEKQLQDWIAKKTRGSDVMSLWEVV